MLEKSVELVKIKEIVRLQGYYTAHREIMCNKELISIVSLNNSEYAVGCSDGTYEIRYKSNHTIKYSSNPVHTNMIRAIICVEDMLITASYDFTIRISSLENASRHFPPLLGHSDIVISLAHIKDNFIVSSSCDKFIIIWDIEKIEMICKLSDSTLDSAYGLVGFGDFSFLSASNDGSIRLWYTQDRNVWKEDFSKRIILNQCLRSICYISSKLVAVGSASGEINILNMESKQIDFLVGHIGMINKIELLDQNLIVTCSDDSTLRIWDLNLFKELLVLQGHKSYVWATIKLSEYQFLSISSDKSMRIWGLDR